MTRFGEVGDGVSEAVPEPLAADRAAGASALASPSLVEQFDRVVAERPDAIALEAGRERLTYRELQSWSAEIASALEQRLASGDRPVATLIGHRPAAVAATLGIARTGRPFMNLDPTLPEARLVDMLETAGAAAVLGTDPGFGQPARFAERVPTIAVPSPGPAIVAPVDHPRHADPHDPACLLFTSGSTGRPKGIIWPQATLIKDARVGRQGLCITASDRIGLVMPIEFVAGLVVSVWGLT